MSRKTILVSAPLGLGALVLLWAAVSARGDQESRLARPERKPAAAAPKLSPAGVGTAIPGAPPAASFVAPPAPSESGEYAVIEARIRAMEERLVALQSKRDDLSVANQDLERQIGERNAEYQARTQAEWRVRQWEQLLGLTETQKQGLLDLWTQWLKADAGRPAGRETWQSREGELRSRLTAEQAARLHDSAAKQSELMWNHLGRSLAGMAGAPKEDHARFQQTLGAWRAPESMLLPEGHGADWPGMMREGTTRLQSVLSPEQMTKLNRYVQR